MSKKPTDLNWYGMLTVENIEDVCKLLEKMLVGKTYTFVASNEFHRFEPDVRTSQKMMPGSSGKPITFWYGDNKEYASFNVCDSYGVWGCSTHLKEDKYDGEFNNPYFVFEWYKVTITHRAPAGHLLYWVIAVERE